MRLCTTLDVRVPGLENGSEKNLGFLVFFKKNLKNLKSPNLGFSGFFYFLVKFYTNHIKFHSLILTCEFCYILHKCSEKERIVYSMLLLGVNFVSSHICMLKSKKT